MLVTAAVFTSDARAHIAMGVLQNNDIPCTLTGEIVNSVFAIHLSAVDGIRLLVNEEDLDRARALIENLIEE